MSEAYVCDARRWANGLIEREHRGPGDTIDAAMHRVETKWGIERSVFWSLRYRPPREMAVSTYFRLKAAFEAECERQEAKLAHELMLTKAALGDAATTSRAVAEATALLAEAKK